MTDQLKPCPACRSGMWAYGKPNGYPDSFVKCSCGVRGPDDDPDGAKWNALPRHGSDGARLRKLRDWLRDDESHIVRAPSGVNQWARHVNCAAAMHHIDRLLAEPEPSEPARVATASPASESSELADLRAEVERLREEVSHHGSARDEVLAELEQAQNEARLLRETIREDSAESGDLEAAVRTLARMLGEAGNG